jgi:hypothetical protein
MYLVTRQDIINDDLVIVGLSLSRSKLKRLVSDDIRMVGSELYKKAFYRHLVSKKAFNICETASHTVVGDGKKSVVMYTTTLVPTDKRLELHQF